MPEFVFTDVFFVLPAGVWIFDCCVWQVPRLDLTAGSSTISLSLSAISGSSSASSRNLLAPLVSSFDGIAESSASALGLLAENKQRDKPVKLLETLSQIEDTALSFSVTVDLPEPYERTLRRFEDRGEGSKSSGISVLPS